MCSMPLFLMMTTEKQNDAGLRRQTGRYKNALISKKIGHWAEWWIRRTMKECDRRGDWV